jgi:hypothetical protein
VTGLSTAFCYFFIFSASFTFPILSEASIVNYYGTFYIYAAVALAGILFVALAVPDPENESDFRDDVSHNKA